MLAGLDAPPSRIAVLSSSVHNTGDVVLEDLNYTKGRKYEKMEAYGSSKMANLLYAQELHKRGEGAYIAASLHPGAINTNLARHMSKFERAAFSVVVKIPFLMNAMLG